MTGLVRLLTTLKFWRKRVAIAAAKSPFARTVARGFEHACSEPRARRRGIRIRVKYAGNISDIATQDLLVRALRRNRVNVLVSAGSYAHDVAMMRLATPAPINIPVLASVAAGVRRFGDDLGDAAEGIVGPSQWEPEAETVPEIGPTSTEFSRKLHRTGAATDPEYPAAQTYAAGLLTLAAIRAAGSLDQTQIRAAFSDLRTRTFYGDFAIDPVSGRQIAHKMLLVQWHDRRKVIIAPQSPSDAGTLEFPSGWRLILASFQLLRLSRNNEPAEEVDDGKD
jgi:ABC-type branched-subunit amino acid transport system substrate-binding protein